VVVVVLIWLIVRLTKRTEGEAATTPTAGAAGWYRQRDGSMRWWDGAKWSEPDDAT
jgi:hypothetical protein